MSAIDFLDDLLYDESSPISERSATSWVASTRPSAVCVATPADGRPLGPVRETGRHPHGDPLNSRAL